MYPPERVSIVLPFRHAGAYLEEAVESVIAQYGFSDWHLYLVNDGSDSYDKHIANVFCDRYPKVMTLLEHEGGKWRGISASRNLAIRQSRGELIAFLDADDTWYPHKLSSQVARLDDCPAAGMIYGPALRWNSWNGGTDVQVPATVDGFGSDCLVPGKALLNTFLRDEALVPCIGSVMIRRSVLEQAGCFEEQFQGLYDDQVLYAKLAKFAGILVSSECVSRYRQHSKSICRQGESTDTGQKAERRFLAWLRQYYETAEPALSSR